jgi:hypothetical protein
LKRLIEASEEFPAPVAFQCLIFAGQILEDERTLAECKVGLKDTLHLVLRRPPTSSGGPSTGAGGGGEAEIDDDDENEGGGKDSFWLPTAIVRRRAVSLASFAGDSGRVTIKLLSNGRSFTLTVRPTTTVLELMELFKRQVGISLRRQRLVFAGNQLLQSKMTLADYGIGKDDDTITSG